MYEVPNQVNTKNVVLDCINKTKICVNGVCTCSNDVKQVLDKNPNTKEKLRIRVSNIKG